MMRPINTSEDGPAWGGWHRLASLISALRAGSGGSATDADPEAAALLSRMPDPVVTAQLLADPAMRRRVAALARVEAGTRQPQRVVTLRSARVAGLAMAAGIAALLLFVPPRLERQDLHRAGAPAAAVQTLPARLVDGQLLLGWATVAGADVYQLDVVDADGGIRFSRTTSDTTLQIPVPGAGLFYRIRARVGDGRWVESGFIEIGAP